MEDSADQVSVRRATTADITQLCGLLTLLFTQEEEFAPDADRQACGLRLIVEQPEFGHIYCALTEGGIVGMVSVLFTVSTAEGGRAAWIEDMVVDPLQRGQGIGERLLHEAIGGARVAGCRRITLLTDAANRAAMRFYSRAGFVRSRMDAWRLSLMD